MSENPKLLAVFSLAAFVLLELLPPTAHGATAVSLQPVKTAELRHQQPGAPGIEQRGALLTRTETQQRQLQKGQLERTSKHNDQQLGGTETHEKKQPLIGLGTQRKALHPLGETEQQREKLHRGTGTLKKNQQLQGTGTQQWNNLLGGAEAQQKKQQLEEKG